MYIYILVWARTYSCAVKRVGGLRELLFQVRFNFCFLILNLILSLILNSDFDLMLNCGFANSLDYRLVGLQICKFVGLHLQRFADTLECNLAVFRWIAESPDCRLARLQIRRIRRCLTMTARRTADSLDCRFARFD